MWQDSTRSHPVRGKEPGQHWDSFHGFLGGTAKFGPDKCRPSPIPAPGGDMTGSWDDVCFDVLEADWSPVDDAADVDKCVSEFLAIWDTVFNRHCPARRV